MTDPITCPECEGRRCQQFGPLSLACRFCAGRGWVGGDHEPAQPAERPPPPPPTATNHKVWSDPWTSAAIGCRFCLGARVVTHLDETNRTLGTAPCQCAETSPPGPAGL